MSRIFEVPLYPYIRCADQDANVTPRHPVVIVGAGPVGLAAAIDLARNDIPVVLLDENDKVSFGSRAICFAKRSLEILDRLGVDPGMVDEGVTWNTGKVFFDDRQVYGFNLLPEKYHKRPAFINLQQYHLEKYLVDRLTALAAQGKLIEIRGCNKVTGVVPGGDGAALTIETPEGNYSIECDWLIACDGAGSAVRSLMELDFVGRTFEDNFLIADVLMDAEFPTERWFWFDPHFNRGRSALLHKQPDGVWRVDLQLGWNIDKEVEKRPERVIPRLKAMLGADVEFSLEWVSIYTFQCRRMKHFRHGRVIFAGDAAHQVSPFGARGANSGFQDVDNLVWKLKLVMQGKAPDSLLDSYDIERVYGADENILNSTRSTDFITPKSDTSRVFRDAVLDLAEFHAFARPLVNSGRLSVPCVYEKSPLNGADAARLPSRTRPGAPIVDAPTGKGWLVDCLGDRFQLLTIDADAPSRMECDGIKVSRLALSTQDDTSAALSQRYLGEARSAVYLVRPDQHIAARWIVFDEAGVREAVRRAVGNHAKVSS